MLRSLLILFACSISFLLSAQEEYTVTRTSPLVQRADGSDFLMPWAGGLNAPQVSSADLDGDGEQDDLYIFDRGGDQHLAFVRNDAGQYVNAPGLTAHFPPQIKHWVLLRDYDCDGITDLFAHSDTLVSGMLVYKGVRHPDGRLAFDRLTWGDQLPILYFPLPNGTRTQIFISTIDYPAVDDLDCDGDLDILTFSSGGGYVEFYQNMSVERGYGKDTLIFELTDDCYGGIYESGLSPEVDLAETADDCALRDPLNDDDEVAGARHAGSTLLTFDTNQDGRKELALGDVSFTEIVLLENGGDCEDAWFTDQELNYPQADVPVDIIFFPAAFYLDIDGDDVRDFIAAPNQVDNSEDYSVFWYYRNEGEDDLPQPVLQDSQFLVRDMIDHGTGANVAPFDANGDGRMDLVVANHDRFGGFLGASQSGINLYQNISDEGEPVFRLVEEDFLDMRQFNSTTSEFAPTFGDLNGDGLADAIIGGQDGKLFFKVNQGNGDFAAPIYPFQDIDAGQSARPRIIDLDRDGVNDLIIGGRDGRVRFYRNIGTTTVPLFNNDPEIGDNLIQLGGIDARNIGSSVGYASPFLVDQGDDFLVFTATNRGQIELYSGVENNFDGEFTREAEFFGDLRPGRRTEVCLADFSGNGKLEMVIGNVRGGLEFFETNLDVNGQAVNNREPLVPTVSFTIFPNPANASVTLTGLPHGEASISIFDVAGRQIKQQQIEPVDGRQSLVIDDLAAGVYVVRYVGGAGAGSRRVVVR